MTSRTILTVAALLEALTGLALVLAPALVIGLLLGVEPSGATVALGRAAGIGLLSLGVACAPFPAPTVQALRAMLLYNVLTAVLLAYVRFAIDQGGALLFPVLVLHTMLATLFAWTWSKSGAGSRTQPPSTSGR